MFILKNVPEILETSDFATVEIDGRFKFGSTYGVRRVVKASDRLSV